MAGPSARLIVLSPIQRSILESMVRRALCPQALALRARVILAAAEGLDHSRIARRLECHRDLPRRWRARFAEAQVAWEAQGGDWDESVWTEKIAALLEDRERSGAPPKFSPEQLCQIVALACEKRPEDCHRPVTHWTARELADEAVQRQIVPSISPRHVGRFLKDGGPAAAPRASLAQQPGSAGKPRGVHAAVRGGGRNLPRGSHAASAGRACHQHR
jgi:transposase